jgi:multidrug/hemolysin transport system permease protein
MMAFVSRCLRVYVRDRVSVFFSLLAPLILLVLYVAFFGKMTTDGVVQSIPGVTRHAAAGYVWAWVVSGLVAVTSISASIIGLSLMASDRDRHRLDDFLVSPLQARQLVGGYLLATAIYTLAVTAVVAVVGVTALAIYGAPLPSAAGWATLVGSTLLGTVVFSGLTCWVGLSLKSEGSVAAAGSGIGTFSGFLAGAYVQPGLLGAGVVTVMNCLPFAPAAVLARRGLAEEPLTHLAAVPGDGVAQLRNTVGMDLEVGGHVLPPWAPWPIMAGWGVVFLLGAISRARTLRQS